MLTINEKKTEQVSQLCLGRFRLLPFSMGVYLSLLTITLILSDIIGCFLSRIKICHKIELSPLRREAEG